MIDMKAYRCRVLLVAKQLIHGDQRDMDELSIREGEVVRIFSKIQVTGRTQAAIYAIRNGLA